MIISKDLLHDREHHEAKLFLLRKAALLQAAERIFEKPIDFLKFDVTENFLNDDLEKSRADVLLTAAKFSLTDELNGCLSAKDYQEVNDAIKKLMMDKLAEAMIKKLKGRA